MSLAMPLSHRLETSATWRQFQKASLCAVTAVALGCFLYGVERFVLAPPHRFLENPADVVMRSMGLAHFGIGWLFLFTSPRLRCPSSFMRLAWWTLVGVGCCLLFYWAGGAKNPFAMMAFTSFFLIHEVRDQTSLFQAGGGSAFSSIEFTRLLDAFRLAAILLLMTVLVGMHLMQGHWFEKSQMLVQIPGPCLLISWSLLPVATLCAAVRAWQLGLGHFGSATNLWRGLSPLLSVYGTLFLLLAAGSLLGSVGLNLIILIHGFTWLVYVHGQLHKRPIETSNPWTWLRRTPSGFLVLHLLVAAAVFVLLALRVYAWQRTGWPSIVLAGHTFPYWALMHICMAFWRK